MFTDCWHMKPMPTTFSGQGHSNQITNPCPALRACWTGTWLERLLRDLRSGHVSLSDAPIHSPPPVWVAASAQCVKCKAHFLASLWPAALWPCCLMTAQLHCSKSPNCEAGRAQGRKSSESRSPAFFFLLLLREPSYPSSCRNSRDFFSGWTPPSS